MSVDNLFSAPCAPPDEALAAQLLTQRPSAATTAAAREAALALVATMRAAPTRFAGVEEFAREFGLATREGVALMALAESVLRVPDDATADALILDKLAAGDFAHHHPTSDSLTAQAFAFALGLSAQWLAETPHGVVAALGKRLGTPALRVAARAAMRFMGGQFVFGETIESALARAAEAPTRFSFDMLGEAARTAEDAARYADAYANAIAAIGADAQGAFPARPGISVKLSALHPRYEAISRARVMRELAPRLADLARLARARDVMFTVDAEEADRLELSLDLFGALAADPALAGWDGLGLAVQAYQKRAGAVIDHVAALAAAHGRRFTLRLVKGAYWDAEIKRAQERGLADYPVFTRKAMTDANYLVCAARLFASPQLFPQFATHNAHSVAVILESAPKGAAFEFQRLHGMGEALYAVLAQRSDTPVRVYAPVGPHRDLLAYLVRRLIENGANSSFVARAADPATPDAVLVADPFDALQDGTARHRRLPAIGDLYEPLRANSRGVDFGSRAEVAALLAEIVAGHNAPAPGSLPLAPAQAMESAQRAFPAWRATPVDARAAALERAADMIEAQRGRLVALLQDEAFKTLDDGVAEVREAADLCRYYARQARAACAPQTLPGPVGEANIYERTGRGVFVAIAPWNFPLAIFAGQIAAALACGNAVVAKPAPQTPRIGAAAVEILHDAGIPADVLVFCPGGGDVGAALVSDPRTAGVVFTGSVAKAKQIARTLAERAGPIVPLIAETGGINAMIVDATALPEQVVDDVLASAFHSAGQRCSALRLLCVQEEIAQKLVDMLIGATRELRIGDPREIGVHLGPVVDAGAKRRLDAYIARRCAQSRVIFAGHAPPGNFVAPHIVRLERVGDLTEEVFGPVLHVVTWRPDGFAALLEEIMAQGYGLTLGLHSRIQRRVDAVAAAAPAGNIYVARSMIGAVAGGQPFGGFALSGTGPKAGGPDYLRPFLRETTLSINAAAGGGDAGLLALEE